MENLLNEIASTPNAPFLYKASQGLIRRILVRKEIPDLSIKNDEFALYARVKRGNPQKSLIVMTHIDHPAIVLKNAQYGIAFGSIGYERISQNLASSPIPVKIYGPTGNRQQLAYIKQFDIKRGTPVVSVEANEPILPNSHALWNIPTFEKTNGIIKMQNADNGAVTAVAIQLLLESSDFTDIDIQVVFVYVEEVHQIASTGIAKRGATPFGKIDEHTFIINLEAMEVETTVPEEALIQELNLVCPKYDAGVLIKVNDGQFIYGFYFSEIANQAESLVRYIAETENICHQYTITTGSTDAKSFSLFPLTPHIITLAVPCKWKHNYGPKGEFVPEEVYERDLNNILVLLKLVAGNISSTAINSKNSLSSELKKRNYGLSIRQVEDLRKQRLRLMKAAQPRLRKGIYFDTNPYEFMEFNYWRVASKFVA